MTYGVHPADEIEAFAQLAEAGHGPEAIAGRFGVTGAHVARRPKFARVWPRLIDALKTDDIDIDRLGALAFTDDHTLQERAFFDTPGWKRTPEQLRAKVTQARRRDRQASSALTSTRPKAAPSPPTSSPRKTRPAGQPIASFSFQLAEAKLQPILNEIRSEGWAWVEVAIERRGQVAFPGARARTAPRAQRSDSG